MVIVSNTRTKDTIPQFAFGDEDRSITITRRMGLLQVFVTDYDQAVFTIGSYSVIPSICTFIETMPWPISLRVSPERRQIYKLSVISMFSCQHGPNPYNWFSRSST